jgi:hypothetical protein
MLSIAWLFESVWGRRLMLAGLIAIAAFSIREHYIHQGEKKQVASQQQTTLKDSTDQSTVERTQLLEGLKAATSALNSASIQIQASQAQQRILVDQLAAVAGQKTAADTQLKKLPDTALHGFITDKLSLRAPSDDSAGYRPEEERAIAECVTDAPLCDQSKALLQKQNDQKDVELKAEEEKDAAVRQSYGLLLDYSTKLEGHYVTLYNAFAAKKRGPQCLYLWHCKRQSIPTPKPADLVLPVGA